ncbi:FitA-like ribbon-helix-helix domain-containing protein [Iningainema tapete]|uniref:FitA-like ribbon-helix-helix domain-containing protein n=1 Tax=Iningainema tapete TaxID=2806730 RepID=UPI001EE2753A|nr:hypothetical protein [Iningainema tapete]
MAQVLVEDIDPMIVAKLEALAKKHNRSLQAEIKNILEQAAQTEATSIKQVDMAAAQEMVARIQEMFAGRTFTRQCRTSS